MYGPVAGTRINPCVPMLPLASTIQGEGSCSILLVGAGPPGQDTDSAAPRIAAFLSSSEEEESMISSITN